MNWADDSRESLDLPGFRRACFGWMLYGDERGWTPATKKDHSTWIRRLTAFLEKRALAFDREGCRAFLSALRTGDPDAGCKAPMSDSSRAHAWRVMKALARWCVEDDMLLVSPMAKVQAPKVNGNDRKRTLTDAELGRILEAASGGRHGPRDAAILALLSDTGIRAGELCGIRVGDVDLKSRTVTIVTGKTGGRKVPPSFGATCARKLWAYMKALDRDVYEPLFVTERGRPFTPDALRKMIGRVRSDTGIRVHAHLFRHDCCTRLLRAGVNTLTVQQQMGHASVSTTELYAHIASDAVSEAYRSASPLDRLRSKRNGQ